jgi:hypothetical protein
MPSRSPEPKNMSRDWRLVRGRNLQTMPTPATRPPLCRFSLARCVGEDMVRSISANPSPPRSSMPKFVVPWKKRR